MVTRLAGCLLALAMPVLVPAVARAEDPADPVASDTDAPPATRQFRLGLRVGYALPFGLLREADSSQGFDEVALGDVSAGQIPFLLDLGYWVTPKVLLGIYAQYGIILLEEHDAGCPGGAECWAYDLRFGGQAQYHLGTSTGTDPWLGLGVGYEVARGSGELGGFETTRTYRGIEYLNLQGGVELGSSPRLRFGPFLGFSIGRFSTAHFETALGSTENDVSGLHHWLAFGIAGAYDP